MTAPFFKNKKILVTGGTGFFGSHLTESLYRKEADLTVVSRSGKSKLHKSLPHSDSVEYIQGDLRDADFAQRCMRGREWVFHLASRITGLGYNSRHPAEMATYNTLLDFQVFQAAADNKVDWLVYPSGTLVYDHDAPVPTKETDSTLGEPVGACKGAAWAKRFSETVVPLFQEEHGLKTIWVRFSNLFGPGDDVDPESAHLLGNIIRDIASGTAPEIWGDGSQLRSYLYVEDAVDALLALAEKGVYGTPFNICGQREYSVKDVVEMAVKISQKTLAPVFHQDKPLGLKRKILDVDKFQKLTAFEEKTSFETGLKKTYDWYLAFKAACD